MPNDDIRRSYNFAPFVRHNRGSTSDIGILQQLQSWPSPIGDFLKGSRLGRGLLD